MRPAARATFSALTVLAVLGVLAACDGGGGPAGTGPDAAGDGVPASTPDLPDDFPLYPGLELGRAFSIGQRYVVEARSPDAPEQIVAFYEESLARGRWQLVGTEATPEQTAITFTAPGFSADGRIAVVPGEEEDVTIVGIAIPLDALDGSEGGD